jgi:excisionase family DNA binding protein
MSQVPVVVNASPELLTVNEAAHILRCSKAHMSNLLNGKITTLPSLPCISLGRRKLIRRAALEDWIKQLEEQEKPR